MARFYGAIGFAETVEAAPGDWEPRIIEKKYKGDVLTNNWRNETTDKVNDDITIGNRISIISNPYAYRHLDSIKYVEWSGVKWKVNAIEVNFPRLILSIGGVYHDAEET